MSSQRQRRPNDSEQNVYLPLTTFLDQPISPPATFATNESSQPDVLTVNENSTRQVRQFTPDFPEEPPPAYNDLFPEGFQQLNESQEITTAEASSNPLQLMSSEGSNQIHSDMVQVDANTDRIQVDSVQTETLMNQIDPSVGTSNLATLSNLDSALNQPLDINIGAAANVGNVSCHDVSAKPEERA